MEDTRNFRAWDFCGYFVHELPPITLTIGRFLLREKWRSVEQNAPC